MMSQLEQAFDGVFPWQYFVTYLNRGLKSLHFWTESRPAEFLRYEVYTSSDAEDTGDVVWNVGSDHAQPTLARDRTRYTSKNG